MNHELLNLTFVILMNHEYTGSSRASMYRRWRCLGRDCNLDYAVKGRLYREAHAACCKKQNRGVMLAEFG
jgi:hypothetical protein